MRRWFDRWGHKPVLPPLPNFLILGASRAGTSTLHAWFGQHPEVFMSRPKELWHFNRDDRYAIGIDRYRARFSGWRGEPVLGECTPIYLYRNLLYRHRKELYWSETDGAVSRIARDLPNAKMLISLRHPLDRFISQYRKNSRRGKAGVGPDLETFASRCGAEGMTYRKDLENVLKHVERERLKIVIFEEWTQSPHAMLEDVCGFLEVSPEFTFDASEKMVRTGDERTLLPGLLARFSGQRKARKESERLSDNLRSQLCEDLSDDITFVEEILGRPLASWRSMSETSSV
jgi:hypothetical protein